MLLNGILLPITTPFYPAGEVYYKKLEHNVARYSLTPASGMAVLGPAGEPSLLSAEERRSILKVAIESAAPEKVMIAGTGLESAVETLRLTEHAAVLGYDAASVSTPHAYRRQMRAENVLAFYRFVADRSPLPVLIGNAPLMTGYDIPAELVSALARHANIIGIEEAGGNVEQLRALVELTRGVQRTVTVSERFEPVTRRMAGLTSAATASAAEPGLAAASASTTAANATSALAGDAPNLVPAEALASAPPEATTAPAGGPVAPKPSSGAAHASGKLRTRQKAVGFQVLAGAAQQLLASLQAGAGGAVAGFAAAAPTACFEVYAAFKDGDLRLAAEKQERIAGAAARIADELGIPGLKYAMDLNGYYGGNSRLPWLPLDAATKAEIERLMSNIRS
jgi:dihydrodipicolinate synthase/N-acetylneuraminate lyase